MDTELAATPSTSAPASWSEGYQTSLEKFLSSHDVTETTRNGYRRRLRHFFLWLRSTGSRDPKRETVVEYKRFLVAEEFTPSSVAAYLVAVRTFFAWAEAEKLYPNVARGVRGTKKQRGFRRDPLTVSQVHQLLASIDRATLLGKRDFALLNLMVRTGERTVEIARANLDDIRQESGQTVLWLQGKGRETKDQFVVLTEATLQPILDYLSVRGSTGPEEPLFGSTSDGNRHQRLSTRSIRRIVKQRLREIQLDTPRLSAHSLRHTTVTLALLAGASIQETQQLARHTDPATTMIYAHNINRAEGIPEKQIDALLSTYKTTE